MTCKMRDAVIAILAVALLMSGAIGNTVKLNPGRQSLLFEAANRRLLQATDCASVPSGFTFYPDVDSAGGAIGACTPYPASAWTSESGLADALQKQAPACLSDPTCVGFVIAPGSDQQTVQTACSKSSLVKPFTAFAATTTSSCQGVYIKGNGQIPSTGLVVAWGSNSAGQAVPPALSGVSVIAAGGDTSAAVKDGVLSIWGSNAAALQSSMPATVRNVTAVAVGNEHIVALLGDGTAVAWGSNDAGQTSLPSGASDIIAVAAGQKQTLLLSRSGTVTAAGVWVASQKGKPGFPVAVSASVTNVKAISAGVAHSLALLENGSVVAFSSDPTEGATGYYFDGNSSKDWSAVITVPSGAQSNVVAIAAGAHHSLALRDDGSVVAWGWDRFGQVSGASVASSNVASIAAGWGWSMARLENGTVVKWGTSNSQHHRGDLETLPSFVQANVDSIASGWDHGVATVNLPACPIVPEGYTFYQVMDSLGSDLAGSGTIVNMLRISGTDTSSIDAGAVQMAKNMVQDCQSTPTCMAFHVQGGQDPQSGLFVVGGLKSQVTFPLSRATAGSTSVCHGLFVKDASTSSAPPPVSSPSLPTPVPIIVTAPPPLQTPPSSPASATPPVPSPGKALPPPPRPPAPSPGRTAPPAPVGVIIADPSGSSKAISAGAIAGIVIAIVAVLLLLLLLIVFLVKRRNRKEDPPVSQSVKLADDPAINPQCIVTPLGPLQSHSRKLLGNPPPYMAGTGPNRGVDITPLIPPGNTTTTGTGTSSSAFPRTPNELGVAPDGSYASGPVSAGLVSVAMTPSAPPDVNAIYRQEVLSRLRIPWDSITVGRLLGEGGFGTVCKGTWKGNTVAIKQLTLAKLGSNPSEAMSELRREALAMCELRNPCIAQVYGLVDDGTHIALIMRFYKRGTVAAAMAKSWFLDLETSQRLKMALQVASGMSCLHERDMLHGDLKTSNLLIEDDGSVVIADFGLAGMAGQVVAGGALTISISPPEVLNDPQAPRTAAGDVYAFAIVLLEIVCGRPAYQGMNANLVRSAVCEGRRPAIPAWMPAEVASLIADCWNQEPAARPSSAEVLNRLQAAVAKLAPAGDHTLTTTGTRTDWWRSD